MSLSFASTIRLASAVVLCTCVIACSGPAGTHTQNASPNGFANEGHQLTAAGSEGATLTHSTDETPAGSHVGEIEPGAAPARPTMREITVPSGTALSVKLSTALASDSSHAEDVVRATVTKPIKIDGVVAVPQGAALRGHVRSAERSARVKGRASIAFQFDRLEAFDTGYDVETSRITRMAPATKRKDAMKIGIGAGAGAVIGGIAGGGKGAAIGSAVGAGAGTGAVLATRGDEIRLPAGTAIAIRLIAPLTLRVPID
jgi:hypothetical protein